MSAVKSLLASEIHKSLEALAELENEILNFQPRALEVRGVAEGVACAQFFDNSYTCVETILFRISQNFENSLPAQKWHSALLRAMTLEIPGIRPRVLSDTSRRDLDELRRFRHCTRYYFDVEYDWRRLQFLFDVFEGLREPLRSELAAFATLLEQSAA